VRFPPSPPLLEASTSPAPWSPPTRCRPTRRPPSPRGQQAGPLPVLCQSQPAHAAGPLRPPALASRPLADHTRDRGHGRVELRTLKAVTVHHFEVLHAAQVVQVTRRTRELRTRRWRTVIVYAITSLTFEQASPARLADLLRGHWAIEALHHLRDTASTEDASQVRTGAGPHVMACLRNLAIGALCPAGPINLAPPSDTTPATPPGLWPPSGSASDEPDITRERRGPGRKPDRVLLGTCPVAVSLGDRLSGFATQRRLERSAAAEPGERIVHEQHRHFRPAPGNQL
jgi:hypothetical protein